MKTIGYNKPLYIQPFDHRESFAANMFDWHGQLTAAQTAKSLLSSESSSMASKRQLNMVCLEKKRAFLWTSSSARASSATQQRKAT